MGEDAKMIEKEFEDLMSIWSKLVLKLETVSDDNIAVLCRFCTFDISLGNEQNRLSQDENIDDFKPFTEKLIRLLDKIQELE